MGPIALFAALVFAISAVVASALRAAGVRLPSVERTLQALSISLVGIAVGHVLWLLIAQDTSYLISVESTRPGLSAVRRAMGLWGGSAGSLLFFTFVIGLVLVVAPLTQRARVVGSVAIAGLVATTTLGTDPFERLDSPAIAGSGLSPILEHWAMIIHPPLLYMGLGLALLPAVVDEHWRRRTAMAAVAVLTVALALGGAWAYVEIGWGGWYAWDPVENVALIPWLLLVAGSHVRPNHTVARWGAVLVWPTVFAGTAMTRTSERTSVHTFANADDLAAYLWPLAIALTLIVAVLHLLETPRSDSYAKGFGPLRRAWPVVVVGYGAVVVALGTFRPFVEGDGTTGTFYSRFLFPAAVVGAIAMGVAPRRSAPLRLGVECAVGAATAIALSAVAGTTNWWQLVLAAALGAGITTTLLGDRTPPTRVLAHLGMILVLVGALGGTASSTRTFQLTEGGTTNFGGYELTNRGIEFEDGPAPVITASIEVRGEVLRPAVTVFPERGLRLPEVATKRWAHVDLQLILRDAEDDGTVILTTNIEPLTQAVWLGVALLTAAALAEAYRSRFSRRALSNSLTVDDAESEDSVVGVAPGGGGGGAPVAGEPPDEPRG